jgi:hypothetical protein
MVDTRGLDRAEWKAFFDAFSKTAEANYDVTIEILGRDVGAEVEATLLPLAYLEYDPKDDIFTIAVGGKDRRLPVVLQHLIHAPRSIFVDPVDAVDPGVIEVVGVVGSDGDSTVVTLYRRAGSGAGAR